MSSPNSLNPGTEERLRCFYSSILQSERKWLRGLFLQLTGSEGQTRVEVDMYRLTTCATAQLYWLMLNDAPPTLVNPLNAHISRMITLNATAPQATDILYLIHLILRNDISGDSSSDSLPECIRHMYT